MRRNNGGVFIWQVFLLPSSLHSHHSCISLLHFFVEIFQEAVSHIRRVCVVPALWYKPVIFDISSKLPCVRALCVTYAALTRFNIKEHFSIFNNFQRPHRAGILFMCCSFFVWILIFNGTLNIPSSNWSRVHYVFRHVNIYILLLKRKLWEFATRAKE